MDEFIERYEFLYHYSPLENLESIRREGLEPRLLPGYVSNAPGQSPIICLATHEKTLNTIKSQMLERVFLCKINTKLVLEHGLSLGFDWTSQLTKIHADQGDIPFIDISKDDDRFRHYAVALEVIGSLACYSIIPPNCFEILHVEKPKGFSYDSTL